MADSARGAKVGVSRSVGMGVGGLSDMMQPWVKRPRRRRRLFTSGAGGRPRCSIILRGTSPQGKGGAGDQLVTKTHQLPPISAFLVTGTVKWPATKNP